jgi:ABC-type amino acid transport substrate-binding protein
MSGKYDLQMNEDSEPLQRHRRLVFFTFPEFGFPKKFLTSNDKKNSLGTKTKI